MILSRVFDKVYFLPLIYGIISLYLTRFFYPEILSSTYDLRLTTYDLRLPKHVIIVHGWKGSPDIAWFPWLIKELQTAGHDVEALRLPHPFIPDRWTWTEKVKQVLDRVKPEETIIIAHSIGCPTTLFALQSYQGKPFYRVVLVSGFTKPFPVPFVHTWFFGAKLDLETIKPKALSWRVIHGEKDPLVPYERGCELANELGVPCVMVCDAGHFTPEERCLQLPEVLRAVTE